MIEQFKRYAVTIALRPAFDGRPLRKGAEAIDGMAMVLLCGSWQEDHESYPGEAMMMPVDLPTMQLLMDHDIHWLASGDMIVHGEVKP